MPDPQADQKFDLALTAIAGAVANLRVAVALIGELRGAQRQEEQQPKEKPEGPTMFGRKAQPRPTTAVAAEPPQSEG